MVEFQVLSPSSPNADPDLISNLAIDISLDEEHRSNYYQHSKTGSSIDSGSVCRTPSDITKNVTFNPQVTISLSPSFTPPSCAAASQRAQGLVYVATLF